MRLAGPPHAASSHSSAARFISAFSWSGGRASGKYWNVFSWDGEKNVPIFSPLPSRLFVMEDCGATISRQLQIGFWIYGFFSMSFDGALLLPSSVLSSLFTAHSRLVILLHDSVQ